MYSVKVTNLSAFEAEDLLADIWIALEKHNLPSPKITVLPRSTKLEIELSFESRCVEDLVRAELPLAMVKKIQAEHAMGVLEPDLLFH